MQCRGVGDGRWQHSPHLHCCAVCDVMCCVVLWVTRAPPSITSSTTPPSPPQLSSGMDRRAVQSHI